MYGNNIQNLLSSFNSYKAEIILLSDKSYSESGSISDISGKVGCYQDSLFWRSILI